MLFNSYEFVFLFLPIVLTVYFCINKKEYANIWLVIASLFFYGYWNFTYLPLLLFSILGNYYISGLIINNRENKLLSAKRVFQIGIFANILLLCYFKYMDFFIGNINRFASTDFALLHIILPLGISFFTITQMVYLVDTYEGLVEERNIINYSLFVTFFPHLLAGPILHHKPIMTQFADEKVNILNYHNIYQGLFLFTIGLFKKVIIADEFIYYVQLGFNNIDKLTFLDSWLAVIAFALQLYFDFSGYSDMAVGVALMFNINIPINFNSPWRAVNIIDFWQRWHISLTNTITTYLYTPMLRCFEKITFKKMMLVTFVSMLISGFWHGAGWNYIILGAMHGLGMIINHIFKKYKIRVNIVLAHISTIIWVLMSFVFFRATSVHEAITILKAMWGLNGIILPNKIANLLGITGTTSLVFSLPKLLLISFCCVLIVSLLPNSNQLLKKLKPNSKWVIAMSAMLLYSILNLHKITEFLYFQF